MQEIVSWLVTVEHLAASVYKEAATLFDDDDDFSSLLNSLYKEEVNHAKIMSRISALDEHTPNIFTLISLEKNLQNKLEQNFHDCLKKIKDKSITKKELLGCIAENECSEWNDLFLYILSLYNPAEDTTKLLYIEMERHKRLLERYLETSGENDNALEQLKAIPDAWQEKFLVVDDEEMVRDVVMASLENEGTVHSAANGKEALKLIGSNYYAAIICDINMPEMDGRELYEKATAIFPNMRERFIFFTGKSSEHIEFFKKNHVKYLEKPTSLSDVKKTVIDILHKRNYLQ